jgi:hypothetical protein
MTEMDKHEGPVFNPEGIRRLLREGGGEDLNDDERALVLALVEADAETGRSLSDEERAALEKLKAQLEGYDTNELAQAVKHMVTSQPREGQKLAWPELKRQRRKPDSPEE